MKKAPVILILVLLLAAVLSVSAFAAEKSLTVPKTEYKYGEDILVTATGEGKDWVGIYVKDEVPGGGPASIYWFYVVDFQDSGSPVCLQETTSNSRDESDLPAGEYTIFYLLDDAYEVYESVDITIVPTIDLNNYSYTEGEDILVTANGEGKDWVGLYLKGETPGEGADSIYWYYVAEGREPLTEVNLKDTTLNDSRADLAELPAGYYTLYLLANDGYEVIDYLNFTVKAAEPVVEEAPETPEETPAEAAPVESPADESPAEAPSAEAPASEAPAETPDSGEGKSGCGSFVGGGMTVLVTILGCGWMSARKRG